MMYGSPLYIGEGSIIYSFYQLFVNLGRTQHPSHVFFIHINAYFVFIEKKKLL